MRTVKNVGEPCAGEPHARFEVAAGENETSRLRRAAEAPLAGPTSISSNSRMFACRPDKTASPPPPSGRTTRPGGFYLGPVGT